MAEHVKLFQHAGERTPGTDATAEYLAVHALREEHPEIEQIKLEWVRHHQPNVWLLFVTGTREET
jgi:hypothetical protein